jgi:peptidyl-prolyl cis-trans isomerase C
MKKLSVALAVAPRALVLALSAALLSPAAWAQASAPAAAASNAVITTVNGKIIPKSRVDELIKRSAGGNAPSRTPDLEKRAADQVVTEELFVQEAVRRGISTSKEYLDQIEVSRRDILARALFSEFRKTLVDEAEIKAEYEKTKAQTSGSPEYKARHILVPKEAEAKALIAQLKKGAKFEELAKKHSKDAGADKNGGDLDWAPAATYVAEFSAAMVKLKKGEYTSEPVKTQFGFHIIKLEDTRASQVPPLEAVRDQIVQSLEQKNFKPKFTAFRDELLKKSASDYKFSE